jgi:hypothetical protein
VWAHLPIIALEVLYLTTKLLPVRRRHAPAKG